MVYKLRNMNFSINIHSTIEIGQILQYEYVIHIDVLQRIMFIINLELFGTNFAMICYNNHLQYANTYWKDLADFDRISC